VALEPVLSGLSSPVYLANAGDATDRRFVLERAGIIKVLVPKSSTATTFLNLTDRVLSGGEQGLLGLAFHPSFARKGRFYVNYTRRPDGATVVSEFTVSGSGAIGPERVLLVIPQPFANHNGGMIEFGPDGYLYVGVGDGGSANDPGNRAQNPDELLGKLLRINVNKRTAPSQYANPSDNPFFGTIPGRDEIYALGFRNPWRFSFDDATGALWVGDVGQGSREEIDVVVKGGNYGWRVMEGTQCTGLDPGCGSSSFSPPVTEYGHASGRCSVTGGYVYRGTASVLPLGTYVFGDYCTGEIFTYQGGSAALLVDSGSNISSFGQDEAGEIYVVGLGGTVERLVNPSCGYSVAPATILASAAGGTGTINVTTTTAACAWLATTTAGWVKITSGRSGTGSQTVSYSVKANTKPSSRTGTLAVAGQLVRVTQAGAS
jgi:hypothetical protein